MGTLQAQNVDAAHQALHGGGYQVQLLEELTASGQVKPTTSQAPVVRPKSNTAVHQRQPASSTNPVSKPQTARTHETPSPGPVLHSIPTKITPDQFKTKKGSDKDLFFLFSQLGSYFKSGVNPALALNDLAKKSPAHFRPSLTHMASKVSEGGRMSDVLEKYPYLYPPDVVGTVRAGEASGFMPEAMNELAAKLEVSHRLKRRLNYFFYILILTIATAPLVYGTIQGALKSIKEQDAAGGNLPVLSTIGHGIGGSITKDLPVTFLIAACFTGIVLWVNSMPMRRFRHVLIIRFPVLGGRARAESMARLTWAMTMVSRAGLSPQRTFLLGLESVPNLYLREILEQEGNLMVESDKLSTVIRRSNILPPEYGNIIETGEITGDVTKALDSVAKATDSDFQARDTTAVASSGFIFYGLMAVVVLILAAWLSTAWYSGLIKTILPEGIISWNR